MAAPNPKSGELLELLTPSLSKGENLLSEFEIHRIIREAKKLPDRYQGLAIEGLALLTAGNIDEGCCLCERGLALAPSDPVSFCNYTIALRNMGLHVKQYEVLENTANSVIPEILIEIATISAFWSDAVLLKKVLPMLNAMELPYFDELKALNETMDYLERRKDAAGDLRKISALMRSIAQQHRLRLAGANSYHVMSELDTVFVEVIAEDALLLSRLNDELADAIISAGLEASSCVGCFQAGEL